MSRRYNNTNKRRTNRDSNQAPNYTRLVRQNPLIIAVQAQSTFMNALRQNLQIVRLEPIQTIIIPEVASLIVITAARALLAGISVQKTTQIDYYAEQPSEQQVTETQQRSRAATDLETRRKSPKHNNPQQQLMLAFDQVLIDLETKLQQQYKLQQGTLTQIVKHDQQATLKFNLCTFISIYDKIFKINLIRALVDKTDQGTLLKTQPSNEIRAVYNNLMLRSIRTLPQRDGTHPTSIDT
ncbi:MAG: hypothetical protein EZS28_049238, partial [Streblomastix strix]